MMKRYLVLVAVVLATLLVIFALAESQGSPILSDPSPQLRQGGAMAALLGVGLLTADAVVPVPSSLIMLAHGLAFGVVVGTFLSVGGSVGSALVSYALGRRGGSLVDRLVPPAERAMADGFFARWGPLAIVVTRPVPLLAETVAVLAGASALGWERTLIATVVGALPMSLIYAVLGAHAAGYEGGGLILAAAILVGGSTWILAQRLSGRRAPLEQRTQTYVH
jgi:uncharacterized membrane protein YdjX (TVP38/TMEM64 family)